MARSLIRHIVRTDTGQVVIAAKVEPLLEGTTTPVPNAYAAETGGAAITSVLTNAQGEATFWLDEWYDQVDLRVSSNATARLPGALATLFSFATFTETVAVPVLSGDLARLDAPNTFTGDVSFRSGRPRVSVIGTDAAAIQSAIDISPAGAEIHFPAPLYTIASRIVYKSERRYVGSYQNRKPVIQQLAGSSIAGGLFVPEGWVNNETFVGLPVEFSRLSLDANKGVCPASTADCLLLMNWDSIVEDLWLLNAPANGLHATNRNSAGGAIITSAVENRFRDIKVYQPNNHGIWVEDTSGSAITDGFVKDSIIESPGGDGIRIDAASGWKIRGNHLYGISKHGIVIFGGWETSILDNIIEDFGLLNNGQFYAGINASIGGERATIIALNHVVSAHPHAANNYQHIAVSGQQDQISKAIVALNAIRGGAQPYGTALVYAVQAGATLSIDEHGNQLDNIHPDFRYGVGAGVTLRQGRRVVQSELAADFNGAATVPTTFFTATFIPESSQVAITLGISGATVGAPARLSATVGGANHEIGTLGSNTNGGVSRVKRITGLTPGAPVTVNLRYQMLGAGTFYCRPATEGEYASFTIEDVA